MNASRRVWRTRDPGTLGGCYEMLLYVHRGVEKVLLPNGFDGCRGCGDGWKVLDGRCRKRSVRPGFDKERIEWHSDSELSSVCIHEWQ